MGSGLTRGLTVLVGGALALAVLAGGSSAGFLGSEQASLSLDCPSTATAGVTVGADPVTTSPVQRQAPPGAPPLDDEQTANATVIITTATQLRLPQRAAVIAVAVAMQESTLRNLDHGDRDSLGLFQQRPSMGWGDPPAYPGDHRSPAQRILDPGYAATAFYRHLLAIPGWQAMPLTQAAQAVQRSAYPLAYAAWETLATRTVEALTGQPLQYACGPGATAPNPTAQRAVDFARAQIGLPYQWGGDGPTVHYLPNGSTYTSGDTGFDCSGLSHAAYAAAGIDLPRTAQTQYDAGPRLPPNEPLLPGDLVFYGTPTHVHHVGVYAGENQMINAPKPGRNIRVEDYRWSDYLGATRPAN